MKRVQQSDQMRFGIVWSVIVHIILLGIVAVQWPSLLDFNQQQQAIQVKIVSTQNSKPIEPKQLKKAEPVFTQQRILWLFCRSIVCLIQSFTEKTRTI